MERTQGAMRRLYYTPLTIFRVTAVPNRWIADPGVAMPASGTSTCSRRSIPLPSAWRVKKYEIDTFTGSLARDDTFFVTAAHLYAISTIYKYYTPLFLYGASGV